MARTPRNSLKKHDTAEESRATKARRARVTSQIRKSNRRDTVAKRRRLMPVAKDPSAGSPATAATANQATPAAKQPPIKLTAEQIEQMKQTLASGATATSPQSHQERFQVLKQIRMVLSADDHDYETIERIIESGIVPVLVTLLNSASPLASTTRSGGDVYKEILWCLTNIASGQYEHTKLVLPAVPRLLQFVEGANGVLAEHSAWVLGNIAADCEEFRQQLIANGAIGPLVKQLASPQRDNKQLATTCAWALSNLARGHETPAKPFLDAAVVDAVFHGIQNDLFAGETIIEISWLLSFLTARDDESLKFMLQKGIIPLLLPHFEESNDQLLLTPLLRVFGNICCGSMDHHTDEWQLPFVRELLNQAECGFLKKLYEFLNPETPHEAHLASESAWVLSNLACLDQNVVQLIVQNNFLPLMCHHLVQGSFEIRKEVAFAIVNIALTSEEYLTKVLDIQEINTLEVFLKLLEASDVAVVGNSLRFVERVLRSSTARVLQVEANGGIDALEKVQYEAQETHLSKWAEALVNEFYGESYGVHSPPMRGGFSRNGNVQTSFDLSNFPTVQTQPEAPVGAGGRGRGAHMTKPAWQK